MVVGLFQEVLFLISPLWQNWNSQEPVIIKRPRGGVINVYHLPSLHIECTAGQVLRCQYDSNHRLRQRVRSRTSRAGEPALRLTPR